VSARELEFAAAVERFVAQLRSTAPLGAHEFAARFPELAPDLLDALEAAEDFERLRAADGPDVAEGLERIGSFLIEGELGRGGMGVVLAAVDEPLGRRVALKLLPRSLLASSSARARFRREASLASRLDHPGICTVYGAGVTDGQPWIAMRLVEGRSLSDAIAAALASGAAVASVSSGSSSAGWRSVASCIAHVARALASAHAHGVLHRDVKPSNVIVTGDGQPVLLDFGVALETGSDAPGLTRTGETAGTPAYLAPELIAGERARPDERCDVYALGVTLYECLTLAPPFSAPTRDALYRAVLVGSPPDVRRSNRAIPRDLAVIVATALERDPGRRYASAEALALDLEAFVAGRNIAARPAGALERAVRWARREPKLAGLAAALLLAALSLAVAGGMLFASREEARAGRLAQQARELEVALVDAYSDLGRGSSDAAVKGFAAVLAIDPANDEASVGRILALLRVRRNEEALELLRAAPHNQAFDRLRAIATGEPPPREDPSWLESASAFELFVDGEALRLEGERHPPSEQPTWWRAALERFDEAIARSPQARAVHHQMRAMVASKLGDEGATRSSSRALVSLWPDSAWSLYQAGSALCKIDPRKALELLRRSAELDPTRAATFQCMGMAHYTLGELEPAIAPLRRALELNPLDVFAHNGLGAVYHAMGCADEARGELYEALSIDPWAIEAWANLTLFGSGMAESARAAEHVLALDPGQTGHRAVYASSLLHSGDYGRARDEFARLVAEVPTNAAYWQAYAGALANNGELRTALDALEVARSLGPDVFGLAEFEAAVRAALGVDG
jgi:tetratricopeptide (TPR) repeat protein